MQVFKCSVVGGGCVLKNLKYPCRQNKWMVDRGFHIILRESHQNSSQHEQNIPLRLCGIPAIDRSDICCSKLQLMLTCYWSSIYNDRALIPQLHLTITAQTLAPNNVLNVRRPCLYCILDILSSFLDSVSKWTRIVHLNIHGWIISWQSEIKVWVCVFFQVLHAFWPHLAAFFFYVLNYFGGNSL